MIKVIGFVGKMQSGKTIGAKYLVETQQYTRLRFADGLKRMLIDGLKVPEEYIDGDKKNEPCEELCGRTGRYGQITLGTEWGRDLVHPNIWVKALEREMINLIHRGHSKFVIDDVRFINEAEWLNDINSDRVGLHSIDSRLIKILRKDRGEVLAEQHRSESEQDNIIVDATIYNDYTLQMYYESINDIVSRKYDKEWL